MTDFKERYNKFFGTQAYTKLMTKQRELYKTSYVRINTSKTTYKKIEEYFNTKNIIFEKTFLPNSYQIKKTFFSLSSTIPALISEIYSQDLASQLPINLLNFKRFKKKIKILDMAAAPGSKLTQLIDKLNTLQLDYEIIALEPNIKRHTKLINNIQKQECENVTIVSSSGEDFNTTQKFDLIFLDAPCSGNLIGDVDWLKKRTLKGIEEKAELQKKILKNASKLLDKNGLLIYSTCSLEPEENEENILWATKNLDLKEIETNFKFPFEVQAKEIFIEKFNLKFKNLKSIRLQPYESNTQGFFVSIMSKKN